MGILASIVIPTCNRPDLLAVCLNALRPQAACAPQVEILVCDDGADDKTQTMIAREYPEVQWHRGPRKGPAANRNLGAEQATGEWIIFIDDDCIPRPTLLEAYLEAIRANRERSVVLEGATFREADPPSLLWEAPHNPKGGARISCNFAIPRKTLMECGAFDERYPAAAFEDTEFFARIAALGVATLFVPGAAVDHPLRRINSAKKLATRWEGKIIYALDQGAGKTELAFRFPEHVAKVIAVRFRNCPLNAENFRAALLFLGEFLWVLWLTPGWLKFRSSETRSKFWLGQVKSGKVVPRYGL